MFDWFNSYFSFTESYRICSDDSEIVLLCNKTSFKEVRDENYAIIQTSKAKIKKQRKVTKTQNTKRNEKKIKKSLFSFLLQNSSF